MAGFGVDGDQVIGLSINVPSPYAEPLRAWRQKSGDPLADLVHPHVTLVPPTAVSANRIDAVLEDVRDRCASFGEFELHLRGTGTFRPVSDVVFVAVALGISHCEALESLLRFDELDNPRTFPYHPHVTVAQDVPHERLDEAYAGLEDFKADFVVRDVAVHKQERDRSWRPVTTLPLARLA